jgi:hypothetical protein
LVWIKEGSWKEGKISRIRAKKGQILCFPWKARGFFWSWKPFVESLEGIYCKNL